MPRFRRRAVALVAAATMVAGIGVAGSLVAQGNGQPQVTGVSPNPVNELDCNGFSSLYKSVKPDMGGLCTDPLTPPGTWGSKASRFYDNGHYIGHDEPSVKFISSTPGSASNMTYFMKLATDPAAAPTANAGPNNTTAYAELSPAPWFGLPICDPLSYPQNACKPQSNTNGGGISDPSAAGSAFMELQFYPPGFTPFVDSPSCDQTHWCAALTIDSLEATYGFAAINPACEEPVNFAYLQTNGQPAGPPSPQLVDAATYVPNGHTLMLNGGDELQVTIQDVPVPASELTYQGQSYSVPSGLALKTSIVDLTTHQSGYMIASAQNGFMDTQGIVNGAVNTNSSGSPACPGEPFNFAAEYSSALPQNQVPWAALEGGVLMEDELGHFEACTSVSNPLPQPGDANVYQACAGGSEGSANTPQELGCSLTTGNCPGATTQAGLGCPPDVPVSNQPNFTQGLPCEYSDGLCMPKGSRPIANDGATATADWPVAGCQEDYFQNGDLDFNGTPYQPDWPNGQSNHPTSFQYIGPFTNGKSYPQVQLETDVLSSEAFCSVGTGLGCSVPPVGAAFYPFWTLGRAQGGSGDMNSALAQDGSRGSSCVWNFGNVIPGTTVNTLGMDSQYGTPDLARYGGTATSPVMPNPQLTQGCGGGSH
ncbi:MAG TPA: hypothetical protein VNH20_08865 [Candidatus Dormibacteraeota bacterium]|nr:hypothetical protein [Candidatus Dormibacteraeota bacterium]HVC40059.1 hypothetical protein [Candidatus Dormibacteraeota bacterium]